MSEKLQAYHEKISPDSLSGRNYFVSLMHAAELSGYLSASELERIQAESVSILAAQAAALCRGASSSVRTETASRLLESVYYTVGLTLKRCPTPEDAVNALRSTSLPELFAAGQELLRKRVRSARVLHQSIKASLFESENVFYRATLIDGMEGFFRLYNPDFFAQETHINADYPAYLPVNDLTGIEFIEQYLRNLSCENRLLNMFDPETVHSLLLDTDIKYNLSPVNLFGPVLTAALCCIVTERPVQSLDCDVERLREYTGSGLASALLCAAAKLECPPQLAWYIHRCIPHISAMLNCAASEGRLSRAVPRPRSDAPAEIVLKDGARMSDSEYVSLLENIRSGTNTLHTVFENVDSLADMLDLLRDLELPREEIVSLLHTLPPSVIAALLARYPAAELIDDDREQGICLALHQFVAALPKSQAAVLLQAAALIRFDA